MSIQIWWGVRQNWMPRIRKLSAHANKQISRPSAIWRQRRDRYYFNIVNSDVCRDTSEGSVISHMSVLPFSPNLGKIVWLLKDGGPLLPPPYNSAALPDPPVPLLNGRLLALTINVHSRTSSFHQSYQVLGENTWAYTPLEKAEVKLRYKRVVTNSSAPPQFSFGLVNVRVRDRLSWILWVSLRALLP